MELIIGANTVIPSSQLVLNIQIFGVDLSEIDFSAYILDHHTKKVRGDDDMIFYGQLHNQNQTVILKTINHNTLEFHVNLPFISNDISSIAICGTMANKPNKFSKINILNIRLLHQNQTYLTSEISGKDRTEAALILGEFYRHRGNWKFKLISQGFNGGLKPLAEHFGVEISDDEIVESTSSLPNVPPAITEQPTNTTSSITNMFKNLFSMPIGAIEKHKQQREVQNTLLIKEREFQELLVTALSDGELSLQEMQQLESFCKNNSLDMQKLLKNSANDINNFLQYTLANIVSDGVVTEEEKQLIDNLCSFLKPTPSTIQNIKQTIERINYINKIKKGDVSAINVSGLVVRNTETVWLHQKNVTTISSKGERILGEVFVTNERMIYKSSSPIEAPLNSILSLEKSGAFIYITAKTKKASCELISNDAEVLEAYIDQALKRFHRQLDLRQSTNSSRHIPQTVRNTVWQRCGGQCVYCQSRSYLEFDHVIPVAKGGSNSETNVQLLCRACNLSKSDKI